MKNKITVERLKELTREYIILRNDEMENHTEWAYVMLEPDLTANEEVPLSYLMQINKDEFDVLCKDHFLQPFFASLNPPKFWTRYFRSTLNFTENIPQLIFIKIALMGCKTISQKEKREKKDFGIFHQLNLTLERFNFHGRCSIAKRGSPCGCLFLVSRSRT